MIEFSEGITLAKQITDNIAGSRVVRVLPPTKPHKFCWFAGDASAYHEKIAGSTVTGAEAFGIYVEIAFDNGQKLCINDGVNLRLTDLAKVPEAYQLLIELEDGRALCFTVAMYGGIVLHGGEYEDEYYRKNKETCAPLTDGFEAYYRKQLDESAPKLSMKAFLATKQRFVGIGNGTAQDILFAAGLHPKRKLETLTQDDRDRLLSCMLSVLREMVACGGRETEKDLFGRSGGYQTNMSKNTLESGCPVCGGTVTKETYLGGSVYYCPNCQPLIGK